MESPAQSLCHVAYVARGPAILETTLLAAADVWWASSSRERIRFHLLLGESAMQPLATATLSSSLENAGVAALPVEHVRVVNASDAALDAQLSEEGRRLFADQTNRTLSSKNCRDNEQVFRIDITTDKYGFENQWEVKKRTGSGMKQMLSGPKDGRNYSPNQSTVGLYCLKP